MRSIAVLAPHRPIIPHLAGLKRLRSLQCVPARDCSFGVMADPDVA